MVHDTVPVAAYAHGHRRQIRARSDLHLAIGARVPSDVNVVFDLGRPARHGEQALAGPANHQVIRRERPAALRVCTVRAVQRADAERINNVDVARVMPEHRVAIIADVNISGLDRRRGAVQGERPRAAGALPNVDRPVRRRAGLDAHRSGGLLEDAHPGVADDNLRRLEYAAAQVVSPR